jgi:hypothetical protein
MKREKAKSGAASATILRDCDDKSCAECTAQSDELVELKACEHILCRPCIEAYTEIEVDKDENEVGH